MQEVKEARLNKNKNKMEQYNTKGKMVKCPKCDKEINYLHAYTETKHTLEIDEKGKEEYNECYGIDEPVSFECPECNEELFEWEGEAIAFLKGENSI